MIECQIKTMDTVGIHIERLPEQKHSLLITGFEGWGNALDVSRTMVSHIIERSKAKPFARINSERFYRYDENRPWVKINSGIIESVSPPGGSFYSTTSDTNRDGIIILKASEPNLRWLQFVDETVSICQKLGVEKVISVGSMYDDVLHSDRIISGVASNEDLLFMLDQEGILPITYSGPGSISSTLNSQASKSGMACISLWCHCPYYLQGTTHYGMVSHLGKLLASLGGFELDVEELELNWKRMNKQIQALINENPELQAMVKGLQKARALAPWPSMDDAGKKNKKIIQIKDFLGPK